MLLYLGLVLSGGAAGQPALVPSGEVPPAESISLWQRGLGEVHELQRDLHRRLAAAVRELKHGGIAAAGFLMTICLLYGVFHAVGPGHGKAVISAYLLANESAVRRGVLLAFLASLVQGLSAVLLVGLLAVLLDMAGTAVRDSVAPLESASYLLVALVGGWLLWSSLRGTHSHSHSHRHEHDGGPGGAAAAACSHGHLPAPGPAGAPGGTAAKAASLVLAVGLRPCSGAVLVLLFALAHGVFGAGVAATFAMSLGTAATVSVLAVLTLFSKRLALAAVGANSRWVETAYRGFGLLGAGLLVVLGAGLFWVSLGPAGPL
jgi:ABC-type nickel/cobalt efflux system permease component RcnA